MGGLGEQGKGLQGGNKAARFPHPDGRANTAAGRTAESARVALRPAAIDTSWSQHRDRDTEILGNARSSQAGKGTWEQKQNLRKQTTKWERFT